MRILASIPHVFQLVCRQNTAQAATATKLAPNNTLVAKIKSLPPKKNAIKNATDVSPNAACGILKLRKIS